MKLLIVRLSAMGDVVHTLPALEALRAACPAAELTWAVEALAAPLLEGHPALDRVVVIDRRGLYRAGSRVRALRQVGGAVRALRRERFDAAIDFQGLARSALLARISGARRVLGPRWAREGAALLYSHGLDVPRPADAHAVERAGAIVDASLAALGLPPRPASELPPARLPLERSAGQENAGPLLVILPGGGKPANRPPAALLAEVADRCLAAVPDLEVVLLGGPGDASLGRAVVDRSGNGGGNGSIVSKCGQLDLAGSARVLARANVVLGGDTGPLHLARALGSPVVALFPAADPFRTGPGGLDSAADLRVLAGEAPCAPCRAYHCRRPDRVRICLGGMPPERVASGVLQLLRG